MSNSQNDSLEDVSNGNNESGKDSASNKKTRFNKSKSISEVFKELDSEERSVSEEGIIESADSINASENDFDSLDAGSSIEETVDFETESESIEESADYGSEIEDDEMEDIIPIHNEYRDLDKSEAFDTESIGDEDVNGSSELDSYVESIVNESDDLGSDELAGSKENFDAVSGDEDGSIDGEDINQSFEEDSFEEDSFEEVSFEEVSFEEDSFEEDSLEEELLEEGMKVVKVNPKSHSSDVLSSKDKGFLGSLRSIEMDSSFIITVLSLIVGLGILIMGIFYLGSSSDRVVDNVLSGETAGLAVFLIIIGLLIVGFSILRFLSSTKADQSSSMFDMLKSIRDIDYDDVKEDNISRDDFDSAFSGVFGKEKHSNFSNIDGDKGSVDKTSDLFDEDNGISDEDIDALYSESNQDTQKTASSKISTGDSQDMIVEDDSIDQDFDIDDSIGGADEEIDFDGDDLDDFDDNDDLKADTVSDLKDKYSKYSFDDDDDKPKFKKSVDISKFDNDLSEEDLEAEKRRKREELEEKKRRIIQGTNFDNSLRK